MNELLFSGDLVTLLLPNGEEPPMRLDGFWQHGTEQSRTLLVFVHGMHSNFYSSWLKKELMRVGEERGMDVYSFNNRGAESDVAYERFEDCLEDIDAALAFGQRKGYEQFVLLGHSTGCQKITYYQSVRSNPAVKGLVLLAPGDDYAIAKKEAGRAFSHWVNKARQLVREERGDERLPEQCLGFSARRYLSVADPSQDEAGVFDYSGPLSHFRRVTCPVLLLFGAEEQYACLPVETMHEVLREAYSGSQFSDVIVPEGDHSFHGCEAVAVGHIFDWLKSLGVV